MLHKVKKRDNIIKNIIKCTGIIKNMSKKEKNNKFIKKISKHPIVSGIAVAFIIAICSSFIGVVISSITMEVRIKNIEEDMKNNFDSLQARVDKVGGDLSAFNNDTSDSINGIKEDIGVLKGKVSIIENLYISESTQIKSSGELSESIISNYQNDMSVQKAQNEKVVSGFQQYVAIDANTDDEYTLPDLEDKTIIMAYDENGEEIFFKGQYDENGYWNGNCIINRYKDDKLTMIMDAIYVSGKLISYEQVFSYTTSFGNDVWAISKRTVLDEDVRSGETWTYFKNEDYEKYFNEKNLSDIDIINTSAFKKMIDLKVEGYYNGYTSEGKYNDSREDAYLVKYKEGGDVRYLYVGRMKDGVPNDGSGNAWSISWGYANDGYHYYKGKFSDGKRSGTPDKDWTKPMSQEKIDSIVNPDNFNCSLQGIVD